MEPTDRSKVPAMIATVMPTAATPTKELWRRTLRGCREAKFGTKSAASHRHHQHDADPVALPQQAPVDPGRLASVDRGHQDLLNRQQDGELHELRPAVLIATAAAAAGPS